MSLDKGVKHALNNSFRIWMMRGRRGHESVEFGIQLLNVIFGNRSIIIFITLNTVRAIVEGIKFHVLPPRTVLVSVKGVGDSGLVVSGTEDQTPVSDTLV